MSKSSKKLNTQEGPPAQCSYDVFRIYPNRLLSFPAIAKPPPKSYKLVYSRNPFSVCSQNMNETRDSPTFEDKYGDRSRFASMKEYYDCPKAASSLDSHENELTFDSHFESGNLQKAYLVSKNEYILRLQYDTGTQDYCHWYFFKVKNPFVGEVTFHIINMMRPEPLIQEGMQPAVLSEASNGHNWVRAGFNISYKETVRFAQYLQEPNEYCTFYTLSFTFKFKSPHDTVHFAYSYPYTYSMLHDFFLAVSLKHRRIVRVHNLAVTLGKNPCDYLVITDNIESFSLRGTGHQWKRALFLSARVHPGETSSSFIMQGLMDFLLSGEEEAKALRKSFVFFVVPMLNPDGVRHGNYRCSLLGVDLNRRWLGPHRVHHPTIFHAKKLIQSIQDKMEIALFCDFHGHSKKKNVFMYGCQSENKEDSLVVVLPSVLASLSPCFSLTDTHYRVEKTKECTARIVVHREFKVPCSYTFESSLYGASKGNLPFVIADYLFIGKLFGVACTVFIKAEIHTELEDKKTHSPRPRPKLTREFASFHVKAPVKSKLRLNNSFKQLNTHIAKFPSEKRSAIPSVNLFSQSVLSTKPKQTAESSTKPKCKARYIPARSRVFKEKGKLPLLGR